MKTFVKLLTCIFILFLSINSFAQVIDDKNENPKPMVNTARKANIHCITPPLGFDTLDGFNGWYSRQLGASIVVSYVEGKLLKMPMPFSMTNMLQILKVNYYPERGTHLMMVKNY